MSERKAKRSDWVKMASGSFGSRNGQPWSRALATANARSVPNDSGAGLHGAVVAPSKEALRAAIESQTCPWCGRGPFKRLAGHTNKEHGIDRVELRDLAGLPRSSSVCSPESSEASRRALEARPDRMEISHKGSKAGQGIGTQAAKELSAARYEADKSARDREIVEAVLSGRPRKEVADAFGVRYKTVLSILRRRGVTDDGRTERGLERKGTAPEHLRAGINRRQKQRLSARTTRWRELGGDHAALLNLAAELGTSHKNLRAYFKDAGLPVPDGRIDRV